MWRSVLSGFVITVLARRIRMRNNGLERRTVFTVWGLMLLACVALLVGAATPAAAQEDLTSHVGELTDEERARANNPIASLSAINLQNFHTGSLWDVPDVSLNTFYIRAAFPLWRTISRASLPFNQIPTSLTTSETGLGDFDIFTAYLFVANPRTSVGVGPLLVAPTAANDALGQGKWQLGLAGVVFHGISPLVQVGGLLTWRTDVGGDAARAPVNAMTAQPFVILQASSGAYVRSTGNWTFDLESGDYAVPVGVGVGQVVKSGSVIYNFFLEPQWTIMHKGSGQSRWKVFLGIHMQFPGKAQTRIQGS